MDGHFGPVDRAEIVRLVMRISYSPKKIVFAHFEAFLLVLNKLSTSNIDFGPTCINCSNHNVSSGLNIWNELENRFLNSRMCFRTM